MELPMVPDSARLVLTVGLFLAVVPRGSADDPVPPDHPDGKILASAGPDVQAALARLDGARDRR
jgi:hypothetical protein